MERRTKIICTLGPSSAEAGVLERMIECGMDVARINFSHGSHKEHFTLLNTVRRAAASAGKPVAVLGDLQGPKIRVGKIGGDGKLELKEGDPLTISPSIELGAAGSVGTSYESLSSNLSPGDTVLLDDGLM
ncbi:MAG: pyruvate kinase, partial [Gemmatimonadota bacterium]|nr:pyruvate kinase [Gemmatimonadota bacterium]